MKNTFLACLLLLSPAVASADLGEILPGNWISQSVTCENPDDLLSLYKGKTLRSTMAVQADGNVEVNLISYLQGKKVSEIGYTAVITVKGETLTASSVWLKTRIPVPLPAINGKIQVYGQDKIRVILFRSPICGFGTSISDFVKGN
jgi:hypothetical protein